MSTSPTPRSTAIPSASTPRLRRERGPRRADRSRAAVLMATVMLSVGAWGCGGDAAPSQAAAASGGRGGRGGPARGPTPVSVTSVRRGGIARSVTVSGIVEPIRTIGVNSQLSGALLSVDAQEGDQVQEGQALAHLDDRELQAQLRAAEANLEVARASYERAQRLRDRQVITQAEFDRERATLAAAQAQADQLTTRAGYARVVAPVTGVVTEKRVEAGDVVANQARLFTIADVSTLVVRVGVSELDVVDVHEGDPVQVTLDAVPDRPVSGRVRRVFPSGDPTTRLVTVEVALNPEARSFARPGFLARITFALGTRDGVLLVPAGALVSSDNTQAVYVVNDERAVRRPVSTGITSEGDVEILEGLSEGEQVVVQGATTVRDGIQVRVVDETAVRDAVDPAKATDTSAAPAGAGREGA